MLEAKPGGPDILRARIGAVEWILFNRPSVLNALSEAMEDTLVTAVKDISKDHSVRVVVFSGAASERPAFMAGADFNTLNNAVESADFVALERRAEVLATAIEDLRMTTIAAKAGPCIGVGAIIAACCDVRIASSSLKFGVPIARTVGNCLSLENYARLTTLLGFAFCKEMFFGASLLGAADLERVQAVRTVVSDADLHSEAQKLADAVTDLAPLTLWATKTAFHRLRRNMISQLGDSDLLGACYGSHDFQEGISAFQEKRKPTWTGS